MDSRIGLLISVMVAAGALGGAINFTLIDAENPRRRWGTSLLAGLGASFLVPLFLNTVKSTLIDSFLGGSDGSATANLLIIAGFCLVAAISSRAFIQTVSDRVLRLAQQANARASEANERAAAAHDEAAHAREEVAQTRDEVAPIVASATEPAPALHAFAAEALAEAPPVSPQIRKVLDAFATSRYTLRTTAGLQGQTKLPARELAQALEEMVQRGWVKTRPGALGEMWYLTSEGLSAMLAQGGNPDAPGR